MVGVLFVGRLVMMMAARLLVAAAAAPRLPPRPPLPFSLPLLLSVLARWNAGAR